jgi:hypothetical protein
LIYYLIATFFVLSVLVVRGNSFWENVGLYALGILLPIMGSLCFGLLIEIALWIDRHVILSKDPQKFEKLKRAARIPYI